MGEISDKVQTYTWRLILKGLAFEGGPSSTKFVYMASCSCIMLAALFMTLVVGGVYIFSKDHHVDMTLVGLVGTLMVSVGGLATNSVNKRRASIQHSVEGGTTPNTK